MTSPEWEAANEDDSDRFPQTSHASAPESTESHERGSRVVPDPARVARYAQACGDPGSITARRDAESLSRWCARAVVAVADEERAPLVELVREMGREAVAEAEAYRAVFARAEAAEAEVERLKRGGKTLGEIIDKQCQMVLDATGLHDWIDEDGDGDWGAIWDHLFVLRDRARAAEAKLAKVEAIITDPDFVNGHVSVVRLRAVLADVPSEQRAEGGA